MASFWDFSKATIAVKARMDRVGGPEMAKVDKKRERASNLNDFN